MKPMQVVPPKLIIKGLQVKLYSFHWYSTRSQEEKGGKDFYAFIPFLITVIKKTFSVIRVVIFFFFKSQSDHHQVVFVRRFVYLITYISDPLANYRRREHVASTRRSFRKCTYLHIMNTKSTLAITTVHSVRENTRRPITGDMGFSCPRSGFVYRKSVVSNVISDYE